MSFIMLDNDVLNSAALSLRAKMLFAVIADKSRLDTGYCTLLRSGLAKILGCNEKTVDRALKELHEKNLIEKKPIKPAEHLTYNHYRPTEKTGWKIQTQETKGGIPKTDSPVQNGEGVSNFDQVGIPNLDRGVDKNDHHNQTEKNQTEKNQNLTACAVEQNVSETAVVQVPSRPPPKPRKSRGAELSPLREREPENDMERVEKAYIKNWDWLYSQGKVKTADPVVNYNQTRALLKKHFEKIKAEQITAAVNAGLHDDFIMQGGYSLSTMLSASVLNRLINSTSKTSSLPDKKSLGGMEL